MEFCDQTPDYQILVEKEARGLLAKKYDVVFLNLWQGSGFKFSMDLAKALKRGGHPLKIYAIGQKVEWFKEDVLRFLPDLDGVILGLGFDSIRKLANGVDESEIPNLILHRDGKIVFNPAADEQMLDLPFPNYSPEAYQGIGGKFPLFTVSLSNQACTGKCVFCVRPENYGRKLLRKPMTEVLDDIENLMERHQAVCFRIGDSTPAPLMLTELAQGIIDRGLHKQRIFLSGFSRIDFSHGDDFELLHKAKIGSLFFGIESLDDNNLLKLKKGISFEAIKSTLKRAHDAGIFTVGSFIFPIPGETEESMKVTLGRIAELSDVLDSVLVMPAGVCPPTEWGRNPEQHGIKLQPDYIEKMLMYPVKFLLPIHLSPPYPYSFDLMGKPAAEVTFNDITANFLRFLKVVREELKIPGIPDFYWTIAQYLDQDVAACTRKIVTSMATRDYSELQIQLKR